MALPVRCLHLLQIALVALLFLVPFALASQGDRSTEYTACVASCASDACGPEPVDDGTAEPMALPWILRATRWSCLDNCKYHCTHRVTNDAYDRVRHIRDAAQATVDAAIELDATSESGYVVSMAERRARVEELVQAQLAKLRPVQKQMVQYHGKWVFIRVLGCQEPMSVLFSLLNLYVHVKAFLMLRKTLPDLFPLKVVYILHTLVSANAWIWSAVFHARDKDLTERLDYSSAGAVILSGFFFTICRLFRLAPGTQAFSRFTKLCGVALLLHIIYLSIGRFDYSYNMTANVLVGMSHNILWLVYSLWPKTFPNDAMANRYQTSRAALRASKPPSALAASSGGSPPPPALASISPPSTSRKARRQLQLILGLTTAATMLELLDFPPLLRALDAHALWHLATVPLTSMWYTWLADDARECVSSGWWIGEALVGKGAEMAQGAATAIERLREGLASVLRGRAASFASSIELNSLTQKLNGFAGFGNGSVSGSEREREKIKEMEDRGLV